MKKLSLIAVLLLVCGAVVAYNTANYQEQGGARWVIGSGGSLDVESGGELDIESGGAFEIAGTAVTSSAAELNKLDGVTATTAQIEAATANPGRAWFNICGDATTVNNNTVYYGPSIVLLASSGNGQTCDINEAGNVTEATADAPIYTNKAFQVLGMDCRNEADANANISYTLRTAAGATVPSVTCTIADGERDCVADVQTTTAIAAGATVAIAAASTSDVGDNNGFICVVNVAY